MSLCHVNQNVGPTTFILSNKMFVQRERGEVKKKKDRTVAKVYVTTSGRTGRSLNLVATHKKYYFVPARMGT